MVIAESALPRETRPVQLLELVDSAMLLSLPAEPLIIGARMMRQVMGAWMLRLQAARASPPAA